MSEVWSEFEGNVDTNKRYDIELHSGQVFKDCGVEKHYGEMFFTSDYGNFSFSLVSQYREADE